MTKLEIKMPNLTKDWTKYSLSESLKEPQKLSLPVSFGGEWAIIGKGESKPEIFLLIFGAVWLLLLSPFILMVMASFNLFMFLFLIPFLAVGFGVIFSYLVNLKRYRSSQKFGSPILLINQERYRPRDSLRFSFQRDFKPNTEIGAGTIQARLVCVEVTRRTLGTDTTYDHHIHYETKLSKQPTFGGQNQLRAGWRVDLPADARPSLIEKDHWIVWELQVWQQLGTDLDEVTSFLIPVGP